MDTEHFIEHEDGLIPFSIVRSDRRTLAVTIARDGAVVVRAPRSIPHAEVARLVGGKAPWIARKQRELSQWAAESALDPIGPGDLVRARSVFADRLAACWSDFAQRGETKPELRVRVMRSRWGSLAPSGRMCLNAHLLRASTECLDYVVFHELCHLRVRGHGPAFYAELARYVPAWRLRRAELRALHM